MQSSDGHVAGADGVRLYYRQAGAGPKTLVIPNGMHLLDDFRPLAQQRTIVCYDLRNRGLSDAIGDDSKLTRGILNDVDDLEAVRQHFGIDGMDVRGHSYTATVAALHAMKYPLHIARAVLIGPMPPEADRKYPPPLSYVDSVLGDVFAKLAELERERQSLDGVDFCRKWWSVLRAIYVADPADADRIRWDRCELVNERNFMGYWMRHLLPSMHQLRLTADEFARAAAPMLVIHGMKDRSAAYGGGRDWAMRLPHARLLTIDNAGHAPWIEAPERVFGAIETFLDGEWPAAAARVTALDPADE